MIIKVTSFIPYLEISHSEYEIEERTTIEEFVTQLGAIWDDDVLVVVNRYIVTDKQLQLQNEDEVKLFIPISGG
ncbi:MoaD/ThiS family protein [Bacillus sp. FJAT-45350]|uniref:MoaD/ThiS family protein n=1 Tax=Bacillus sp. FJAT-45350 TaxID=2011014 RepID=UPI000BB9A7B3|nr:MoaD/ThiS family protein [Bacillus sp. FJAT-45350]